MILFFFVIMVDDSQNHKYSRVYVMRSTKMLMSFLVGVSVLFSFRCQPVKNGL